jgi:hypothetical protein
VSVQEGTVNPDCRRIQTVGVDLNGGDHGGDVAVDGGVEQATSAVGRSVSALVIVRLR